LRERLDAFNRRAGKESERVTQLDATVRQRVCEELQLIDSQPSLYGELMNLVGVQQEDVTVGIWLELDRLIDAGVGAVRKAR
jgi:hypothetical protein